jgi:hypothetical protein
MTRIRISVRRRSAVLGWRRLRAVARQCEQRIGNRGWPSLPTEILVIIVICGSFLEDAQLIPAAR